jgi:hypothetical protein
MTLFMNAMDSESAPIRPVMIWTVRSAAFDWARR